MPTENFAENTFRKEIEDFQYRLQGARETLNCLESKDTPFARQIVLIISTFVEILSVLEKADKEAL